MRTLDKRSRILLVAACVTACILISTLAYTTKIRQTGGDSILSLIVSQSIIQDGTIKLNKYTRLNHYALVRIHGNTYDYFPLGTPVLSIPAVYIMNRLGMDMIRIKANELGQIYIMMAVNPMIFLLIFLLGRYYVSDRASFIISLLSFLGSPLTSTLNVALWSHNFALLISLLIMHMLVRYDQHRDRSPNPYLLGTLLFLAYLTRPTFSIFILATFAYLAVKDRHIFFRTAATAFCLLMGFVTFSLFEIGQPLPPYYINRLGSEEFFTAIFGILLSPSRGLYIYIPFLLVVTAGAVYYFHELRKNRIFLLAGGFALAHILSVAMFPIWSGGHCYGPRLLVDSFPAFILLTFILWRHINLRVLLTDATALKLRWPTAATYIALALLAVWIHSYQGLYNQWTYKWNKYPPLGTDATRIIFDWRHPQILSSGQSLKDKLLWFYDYRDHEAVIDEDNHTLTDFDLTTSKGRLAKGMHLLRQENHKAAMEEFHKAIAMPDASHKAYQTRGSLYLNLNDMEMAIADFSNAISINPRHSGSYLGRAIAYSDQGLYKLALADYMAAEPLVPEANTKAMRDLYYSRGLVRFWTSNYIEAAEDLKKSIQYGKNTSEAYYYIGTAFYAARRYEKAAREFESLIAMDPTNEKARLFLLNSLRKDTYYDTGLGLNDLKEFVVSTASSRFIRTISRFYLSIGNYSEGEIIDMAELEAAENGQILCETYYYLAEQRLAHNETIWARGLLKKGEKHCAPNQVEYHTTKALLRWLGR